jgi:beta-xylosidase
LALLTIVTTITGVRQTASPPWISDQGDGSFRNPVLYADYSDPDAVRVGDDFFMTSSSFTSVPGLPILHSRDLVNWRLVNHALPRLVPPDVFEKPQHGGGVWAPAIRYHDRKYWIYYPDPDRGIYVTTATDPRGEWSVPRLVKAGRGLIDPCPLWDDDGTVHLIHAFARSRAGFANVLHLNRLTSDGTGTADEGRIVIDGNKLPGYTTLEGPKLYKRNGWYYVFAPAGGVRQGWQSVFRSRKVEGPYDGRIVLAQGGTDINGPHQGALVDTRGGDWWFLHFQDLDAYGRVVHLQPVTWRDDWPVIGDDRDGDGNGEPRREWRRPRVPAEPITVPPTSDDFATGRPGLQWQWQANPHSSWATPSDGGMRLSSVPGDENLWSAANLLLQKFPAPNFRATAVLDVSRLQGGERAGLIVFGADYAWVGIQRSTTGLRTVRLRVLRNAADGAAEQELLDRPLNGDVVTLAVTITSGGRCQFAVAEQGHEPIAIGTPFVARPGRWVGAKVGVFASAVRDAVSVGTVTVRSFLISAVPR